MAFVPMQCDGKALLTTSGRASVNKDCMGACCFYDDEQQPIECLDLSVEECNNQGGLSRVLTGYPEVCPTCAELEEGFGCIGGYIKPCCIYDDQGNLEGCEDMPVGWCEHMAPVDYACLAEIDDDSPGPNPDPAWRLLRCDHPCVGDCPEPEPPAPPTPNCAACDPAPGHAIVSASGFEYCPYHEPVLCHQAAQNHYGNTLLRMLGMSIVVTNTGGCSYTGSIEVTYAYEGQECETPYGPFGVRVIANASVSNGPGGKQRYSGSVSGSTHGIGQQGGYGVPNAGCYVDAGEPIGGPCGGGSCDATPEFVDCGIYEHYMSAPSPRVSVSL